MVAREIALVEEHIVDAARLHTRERGREAVVRVAAAQLEPHIGEKSGGFCIYCIGQEHNALICERW